MKRLLLIAALLIWPPAMFATGQLPERLIVGKDTLNFINVFPADSLDAVRGARFAQAVNLSNTTRMSGGRSLAVVNSALSRGYQATWRLQDDSLRFVSAVNANGERIDLGGALEEGELARWFSGEILAGTATEKSRSYMFAGGVLAPDVPPGETTDITPEISQKSREKIWKELCKIYPQCKDDSEVVLYVTFAGAAGPRYILLEYRPVESLIIPDRAAFIEKMCRIIARHYPRYPHGASAVMRIDVTTDRSGRNLLYEARISSREAPGALNISTPDPCIKEIFSLMKRPESIPVDTVDGEAKPLTIHIDFILP